MSLKENDIHNEQQYERKQDELLFALTEARNEIQISLESVAEIIKEVLDEAEIEFLKDLLTS